MKSIFPEGTQIIIYKFKKVATQSGLSKTKNWRIRFTNSRLESQNYTFDLMQWNGGFNTLSQPLLKNFKSLESALKYAQTTGLPFKIEEEDDGEVKKIRPKSYAANFR